MLVCFFVLRINVNVDLKLFRFPLYWKEGEGERWWGGAVRAEGEEGVEMTDNKRDKMKLTDFVVLFLLFLCTYDSYK